jgi:hypothetical protein
MGPLADTVSQSHNKGIATAIASRKHHGVAVLNGPEHSPHHEGITHHHIGHHQGNGIMGCSAPISLIYSVCRPLLGSPSNHPHPRHHPPSDLYAEPAPTATHPRPPSTDRQKREEKKKKKEDRTEPTELSASERSKIAVANASRESRVHGRLTAQPTNRSIHYPPPP